MAHERQLEAPFPVKLLTGALIFSGVLLIALVWSTSESYRKVQADQRNDLRLEELRGEIVHLDEVLTMSARLAAVSGDLSWEQRYRQYEPKLDAAVKEAIHLTSRSGNPKAVELTDAANLALVDMENRSFALVRAGRPEEARAILFSPAYEKQKAIYAEGMSQLVQDLREQVAQSQHQKRREAIFSILLVALAIAFLVFTWFKVLGRLHAWRAGQLTNFAQLSQTEDELRKAHDLLEKRVEQRTHELANSLSLVHATLESTADGILVTDHQGKVTNCNHQFIRMWRLPRETAPNGEDNQMWDTVLSQLSHPEQFLARFKELRAEAEAESFDILEFKDGRVFERYSKPQQIAEKQVGRVWSFRDVTQRKRAEVSALAYSTLSRDLSSAVSAVEAARIIGDASNEFFGWDCFWIQLYSEKDDIIYSILEVDTFDGKRIASEVPGPRKSSEMHRRILRSGAEIILRDQPDSVLPHATAFGNKSRLSASILMVPIRSASSSVGILSIQSYTPRAYNEQDLIALQVLADQCAGALERIWADEARRQSESQFRLVWNASNEGMRLANAEGVVQLVNDAYCQMTGKAKEELEGHSISVIEREENKEAALRRHQDQFNAKTIQSHLEEEFTFWDGRKVWLELSNSLLPLPGQAPLLLSVFRDITDRKQSEQTLRRTEELYRGAITGVGAVPYVLDYKTKSYVFIGDGIQQLIGYGPQEVNGQLWKSITQESIMLGEAGGLSKAEATTRVLNSELRHWRCDMRVIARDGKTRWISDASVQNLDESGHPIGSMGIFQDITERKRSELRITAFMNLGQKLSSAKTAAEAGNVIIELADQLFGWDSCALNLRTADNRMAEVLNKDTIDGQRIDCPPDLEPTEPTPNQLRTMQNGPQLILRSDEAATPGGTLPFGDTKRASASAMHVPVRDGAKVIGVLAIFSYTPNAYTAQDLPGLQSLADHCGGALNRIQADEAQRRTEELYRRAIAGAGAVPYSYNYKTRSYNFIGEGITELVGYPSQEITASLWKEIIKESIMLGETAGLEKNEAARRVLAGEIRYWRCDMRVVTREGKSRWISDTSVQSLDESGRPTGSVGILQDITERKQAEITAMAFSKLGRSLSSAASPEEAAQIIAEVSRDLFGWDCYWVKLYTEEDDTVCSVLSLDTCDGKQIRDTESLPKPPTELHRRILNCGAELIQRDDPKTFLPGAIPFGDKSRPSASLMYVPIRDQDRVIGILSIQSYTPRAYTERDLNTLQTLADHCGGSLERIRADEARRQSESQFRLVWNSSADGMRLTDRDGLVLMVNDAYCQIVGKTKVELEGKFLSTIHLAENQERVVRAHQALFDSSTAPSHLEKHVTLWDGRKIWLELSNSLLCLPGQPPLLLSIFRDITQRKDAAAELEVIHRQLLDASRKAGMAEVATGVLHNVGNVLNSVNVSASLVTDEVRQSKAANLSKIAALLKENQHQLAHFFTVDPRGKELIAYVGTLSEHLGGERKHILEELELLRKNIEHIKDIVAMQQSYAKVSGVVETVRIVDLVEDALNMNAGALKRHQVRVIREYVDLPPVTVERHKVLQILVNLIRNAKYACDDSNKEDKQMIVRIRNGGDQVKIFIIDNGIGIPAENLTRIFSHGFTTRKGGHGFGLHSGALAAKELGGSLNVHSDGPGQGASFVLQIPCRPKSLTQAN
jgi:PAS domain S-box-containing protein